MDNIWLKAGNYNSNEDSSPEKWYQDCLTINLPITRKIPFFRIEMPKWLWVVLIISIIIYNI